MTVPIRCLLPRDHVTTTLEAAVMAYPLVVLTAPMGYGKTTAARQLMSRLCARVYYVGITPGQHNAHYLWDMAFAQLASQGSEIAPSMRSMGFPADAMRMQCIFEQGRTYLSARPTLLVVDDYHYAADPAMDDLLEALAREGIPNFHILLISRTLPRMALEDMRLKGIATLFDQQLLTFSKEETCAYFALHGTEDVPTAESAWRYTEGWAAALWLSLQSCRTHGTPTPARDLESLFSETVFSSYDAGDQAFLLQLSVFSSFTSLQAAAVCNDNDAPQRLRSLHNRNAFISYDPVSERYQLHSLFRYFLKKCLRELPSSPLPAATNGAVHPSFVGHIDKPVLYRLAGEWLVSEGDTVQGMHYFFQAGRDEDLLRILELFAVPGDGLFVMFDPQGVVSMLNAIPWEIRYRCPLGWLAFISHYMSRVSLEEGLVLLKEASRAFAGAQSLPPDMKQRLAGEIEIIFGIEAFNDLFAMRERYAKAHTLLQGSSAISHPQLIWTFGSPHAVFHYLREPGSYEKLVRLVENNMHLYQELTNGCSAGAQDLFRAEFLLETDQAHAVEPYLRKAAVKAAAKEQHSSLIAINFTMSRLLLRQGKVLAARELILNMLPGILKTGNPLLRNSFDLCQGYLAALAGYKDEIPLWLRQGKKMAVVRGFYQVAGFALIVHGKALLLAEDWPRLEALAEDIPSQLGVYNNLFGSIHAAVFRAIAVSRLRSLQEALPFLEKALNLAQPDGIVCSLAEYGTHLTPLLRRMGENNRQNPFIKKLERTVKNYATLTPACGLAPGVLLAAQERAVLEKAIEGLSNNAIAAALGIAPTTVRNTLSRVYAKLGVNKRTKAIQKWQELQL